MRRLARSFTMIAIVGMALATASFAQKVTAVEAVGFTVSDMDRSVEFYSKVLHFKTISDSEFTGDSLEHLKGVFGARVRVVRMGLGSETIQLSQYLAPEGKPIPIDSRSNDAWFQHIAIVVRDMDEAYSWLRKNNVRHASSGPQTLPEWNPNAGGIRAFYFRDPDGHFLEAIWFPKGKGAERWHERSSELFLGIDHTAIVVRDTDKSLGFYRDLLGMKVAGNSENFGPEQERLNNVFGARLRITALRAASGPGVELLEYLAPKTGRMSPEDLHANDLVHWETLLTTECVQCGWKELTSHRARLISSAPEAIDSNSKNIGFAFADPDGHVFEFIGPAQQMQAENQR